MPGPEAPELSGARGTDGTRNSKGALGHARTPSFVASAWALLEERTEQIGIKVSTWTPKVCKIMAFKAANMGLGLSFYTLLGFRYTSLGFRVQVWLANRWWSHITDSSKFCCRNWDSASSINGERPL